jgi:hypothetical protein
MASAHGHLQVAAEDAGGTRARRGAPPTPGRALGGPAVAGAPALAGHPRLTQPARLAGSGTGRVREAHLLRLQRAYGNAAVGWHLQRGAAPAVPEPVPAPGGRTAPTATATGGGAVRVQRWKDDGHIQTTVDAAGQVFTEGARFFRRIGMSRTAFITALGKASINMDKVVPHLTDRFNPFERETKFYKFGLTLASSVASDMLPGNQRAGQTRRGIKGEGPNHGEAGYYDVPRAAAVGGNVARQNEFVKMALEAYQQGQFQKMIDHLGDACHVAADRGSHAEGGQGEGHDTRMPDPSKNESGTNLRLGAGKNFMEGWADNDVVADNPIGYSFGLSCTVLMLREFFDEATGQFGTENVANKFVKPLPSHLEEL